MSQVKPWQGRESPVGSPLPCAPTPPQAEVPDFFLDPSPLENATKAVTSLFFFSFVCLFLGLHSWHMEVPRLGVE